ncbi:MAG: 3-hydroxyacyl-CoA dehydrogenase [Hyphomicrobiaceae bacterium]
MIQSNLENDPTNSHTQSVAIIGSGLIGLGWAIVFSRAGWQVKLYDLKAEALAVARTVVNNQLQTLSALDLCGDPEETAARISYEEDLSAALADVDYVQECGPEILDIKRELFSELDRLVPEQAIIASSTSGFMASQFTDHLPGRHRTLVAHPVNPPHLIALVEVSPAEWTANEITTAVSKIMTDIGQTPIVVQKEIPGFILNRLQGALLNEALRLAQQGYATPDDIDKTVRDGLGLRWSFMGPFETIDLNAPSGLSDYAKRYGGMYTEMAASQSQTPDWSPASVKDIDSARRQELSLNDIAERQAWRDERLAALVAHKYKQKR